MGLIKIVVVGAAVAYAADMVATSAQVQSALGANAKYAPYLATGVMLAAAKHFNLL